MDKKPISVRRLCKAADTLALQLERAAQDKKQLYRYLVSEKNEAGAPVTVERIYEKADLKAAREMTAAMKELNALLSDLHGLTPDETQTGAVRVILTGETAQWSE